ncbi:MAG: hypothetical protein FJ296_02865 [Planctomycetes bacterium]|nr:hypothetical protein [Planctomycetota bacterium]
MSPGERAWSAIRHDIGRKLLALVLALFTWAMLEEAVLDDGGGQLAVKLVRSVDEAAVDRASTEVPAIYLVVPPTLVARDIRPQRVTLKVKGLKDDVQGLSMWAYLEFSERDLGDGATGWVEVTRTLGREDFRSRGEQPELTLFRVNGESTVDVRLQLARRVTRSLPLGPANVVLAGEPAKGFQAEGERATVSPGQVDVSGPAGALEDLAAGRAQLQLAPVSVLGRSTTASQSVGLSAASLADDLELQTPAGKVQVIVPVVPLPVEIELVRVPVVYRNEDALKLRKYTLVERPPDWVDIRLRGPQSELGRFQNNREELLVKVALQLDWSRASLTDGPNSAPLECFTRDLSVDVQVTGIGASAAPKVQFKLEALVDGP